MAKNYKNFLLAGLSGLILALAYPGWNFDAGLLAWLGFIPLLFAFQKTELGTGWAKRFFLTGFFGGLVYFLIIFRWFWSFYPLDTLGIKNGIASVAILLPIYLITTLAMAAFWGFFGLAFGYLKQRGGLRFHTWDWLILPAIFIFLEYIRVITYGLVWFGPGTLFGAHWTMGNPAYMLAGNSLILRLAPYTGIYGIMFLVLAINFLLLKILLNPRKKMFSAFSIAAFVLIITFVPKLLYKKIASDITSQKITFAIIQTNTQTKISPNSKETLNTFKEQLTLLNLIAKNYPKSQVIIFPEASDFFKNIANLLNSLQAKTYFSNLFKEPHLLISGIKTLDQNDTPYSRVLSLDTKKDILGYYDKQLLTPGGEFLPYTIRFLASIFSKTKISEFNNARDFQIGKNRSSTVDFEGQFKVAPIICSELLSPSLTRSITQNSDIITGMASYGIFHGKETFSRQNLAAVQFRAVENNKPIILASNMGRSYAVDSTGKVTLLASDHSSQILTGGVAFKPQKSWYNKVGDWPIFLVSFLLITSFIFLTRPRKHMEA
jgi:apolipoprotein N-acyltransferase